MKKKSKLEKLTPLVLGTCMLTLVAACGSDDDDSSSSTQAEQQTEGVFTGVLAPVNSQVTDGGTTGTGTTTGDTGTGTTTGDTGTTTGDTGTGTTTGDTGTGTTTGGLSSLFAIGGTVSITKAGEDFQANVEVTEATAAIHHQHIHNGSRCPTPADDTNSDGFVDAVEAAVATGQIIVPLDSDLNAQDAGGVYPSGANYSYNESATYSLMLADLRLPDTDTSDSVIKLGATEELDLNGKVVEIHGVPSSTTLPATVLGIDGMSPQQSLPVACAVLSRTADSGTTTGTTTGDTGTTTGDTGTTTGDTGTTTGDTGTTTGTTTGGTGTGTTTGTTGTTTGM